MALTVGTGPFGSSPGGRFNFSYRSPAHVVYIEDAPRRVRVKVAGRVVADSRRMKLLHETGLMPVYYFPKDDVDAAALAPSDTRTSCPFKGEASYHHLVVGDRRVEDAAWYYPSPNPEVPDLQDRIAFYWGKVDTWLEEDEEISVHPRDPYHRVDALRTSRAVRVSVDGVLLAESDETIVVFETGLPPRHYFPKSAVRFDHLEPTQADSRCPYKGHATEYWTVRTDAGVYPEVAWCYPHPDPAVAAIADRVCFYDEKLDVDLDGVRQERPVTKFS
jgi:uncharacterized protein (DUF427 family)